MTWVKLSDAWVESRPIESLSADAAMLHISALSYCARQSSDGDVPQRSLRRLWPAVDVDLALKELIDIEEWVETETGWHITNWRDHVLSAEEMANLRERSRLSSERYRRHKAGDHSMCERCAVVKRDQSRDPTSDQSRDWSVTPLVTSRLVSSRSVSSRHEVKRDETESGADADSAGATPAPRSGEEERTPHRLGQACQCGPSTKTDPEGECISCGGQVEK